MTVKNYQNPLDGFFRKTNYEIKCKNCTAEYLLIKSKTLVADPEYCCICGKKL